MELCDNPLAGGKWLAAFHGVIKAAPSLAKDYQASDCNVHESDFVYNSAGVTHARYQILLVTWVLAGFALVL